MPKPRQHTGKKIKEKQQQRNVPQHYNMQQELHSSTQKREDNFRSIMEAQKRRGSSKKYKITTQTSNRNKIQKTETHFGDPKLIRIKKN